MDDYIDRMLEAQTEMLNQALNSTEEKLATCPVCEESYSENNPCWLIPHPCGNHMPADEAYCCSELCARVWVDRHWAEIDDFIKLGG